MPQKLRPIKLNNYLVPRLADGSPLVNQVDRFPVSDKSLFKANGFPCSDIGILDRFSREQHSKEEIDFVASRLAEIKAEPANKMSDDDLIRTLRPAWCQTASEIAAFDEHVYTILSDKAEELRAKKEVATTTDVAADNTNDGGE